MIVTMFPEPREQAKTIGVYWHWIFFINLPIGIATALSAIKVIDKHDGIGLRKGADIAGAALLTAGLMLGVYTILQVGSKGWGSTQTLARSTPATTSRT
jgi:hypothetical protein